MGTRLRLALLVLSLLLQFGAGIVNAEPVSGRVFVRAGEQGHPHRHGRHLAGVTITLRDTQSGAVVDTTVTGEDGGYRFRRVADGSYEVAPAKPHYAFEPVTRSVTVKNRNVKDQDFVALRTHSIAGRVITTFGGASVPIPLAGATLTLSGAASATAVADANGYYSFAGLLPGTYAIVPTYQSWNMFGDARRVVMVNRSNVAGQDFSGFSACMSISGFCPNGNSSCPDHVAGCVDSDGDGLCDAWERAGGIDLNGDGTVDAVHDLLLPGADPNRKDLYLELDHMVAPDHSHRPRPESIQAVVDAFDRQGITLHVDPVSNAIPESSVLKGLHACPVAASQADLFDLKAQYSDPKRRHAYHYGVFAHYHSCDSVDACSLCRPAVALGSAGTAELPGNDFIVSFGIYFDLGFGVPPFETEAATLMHEFGHTLGLRHGGDQDEPNWKPNYLSAMNYNFSARGIPFSARPGSTVPVSCTTSADCPGAICTSAGTCARIDYSAVALPALDEKSLDEAAGIGAGTTDITTYDCPNPVTAVDGAAAGPIDWNCNGNPTEAGVVSDVTADDRLERLTGHADWPNLVFRFQCTANGFANAPRAEAAPSPEQARGRGVLFPPLAVRMELLPGVPASAKVIFAGSSREIAVAVFGDDRFNATQTDRASLRFAGGAPTRVEIVDVDRDGRSDLLLFFRPDALRLDPAMRRLTLSGSLTSSQRFSAEAEVLILQ